MKSEEHAELERRFVELLLRDVDELRLQTTYTLNHYAAAVKRRGMDYVHEKLCGPGREYGLYRLVRVGRGPFSGDAGTAPRVGAPVQPARAR